MTRYLLGLCALFVVGCEAAPSGTTDATAQSSLEQTDDATRRALHRLEVIRALIDTHKNGFSEQSFATLKPYMGELDGTNLTPQQLEETVFAAFDQHQSLKPADAQNMYVHSAGGQLDVRVFANATRQPDALPKTIFVLTHGTPKTGGGRMAYDYLGYMDALRALYPYADVAFVHRAGAGDTALGLSEAYGSCATPDYATPTYNAARHMRDVAVALRQGLGYARIVFLGQSSGGLVGIALAAQRQSGYDYVFAFNAGRGEPTSGKWCDQVPLRALVTQWTGSLKTPLTLMISEDDPQMELDGARDFYKSLPVEVLFYKTPENGPAHPLMGVWSFLWAQDVARRLGYTP
jgi:pimeloyl-ACP methyl ester carboxylesterase